MSLFSQIPDATIHRHSFYLEDDGDPVMISSAEYHFLLITVVGYFDSDEKDHGCLSFDALAKLAYSG